VDICALVCDSRQVTAGAAFFALPGTKVDGRSYIPQAIAAGAVAIVADSFAGVERVADCCFVRVGNVRRAMALAAAHYYGYPGKGIPVIGVTGTNGKTTITYVIEAILKHAGYAPAVFGTVDYRLADTLRYEATHTTPESLELMRMLAEFRRHGADALVMDLPAQQSQFFQKRFFNVNVFGHDRFPFQVAGSSSARTSFFPLNKSAMRPAFICWSLWRLACSVWMFRMINFNRSDISFCSLSGGLITECLAKSEVLICLTVDPIIISSNSCFPIEELR